jgi:hypothetical protein
VNQNARASSFKRNGEVGKLWKFLREIIQGAGLSDAKSCDEPQWYVDLERSAGY